MPARIRIFDGPDKGAETLLTTGEVSIGRGVGCQFVVTDEAFDGRLRVYFENGTYWAANRTEQDALVWTSNQHAGGQTSAPFPAGSKQVWHHGDYIQMTDQTTLVLTVETAGDDIEEDASTGAIVVTRQRTPEDERKARNKSQLLITVVCAAAAVILFAQPPTEDGPVTQTRTDTVKKFDAVTADLEKLRDNPKYARSALIAHGLIRDARLDEVSDRGTAAFDGYSQARDELDRALGDRPTDDRREEPPPAAPPPTPADTDPAAAALRAARDFTADRLVFLARTATAPRAR